ncbi:MAG: tyrosine-type recombinase/integrase [Salinarimonas sp.]
MAKAKETAKLDKRVIDALKPRDKEFSVWDTEIPFYCLRVQPGGAKTFMMVYRAGKGRGTPVRRYRIGNADRMAPAVAREAAKKLAARIHLGEDPAGKDQAVREQAKAERAEPTVGDILDRFVSDHVNVNLKESTKRDYRRIVEKILKPALGKIKARALKPSDVGTMHHAMRDTRTQADQAVRVLSSAMKLAEQWGLRDPGSNPCGIRKYGTRRREFCFSTQQVARMLQELDTMEIEQPLSPFRALAVRLLFVTGCRAGEIINLEWKNVDFEQNVLRWKDTKTGYLVKPMTSQARELLEAAPRTANQRYVASEGDKPIRIETLEATVEKMIERAEIETGENASCHLIRHWFCSAVYSDATIPLPEQMRICGHKSAATALRYAHTNMKDVHRSAEANEQRRLKVIREAGAALSGRNVVRIA